MIYTISKQNDLCFNVSLKHNNIKYNNVIQIIISNNNYYLKLNTDYFNTDIMIKCQSVLNVKMSINKIIYTDYFLNSLKKNYVISNK